MKSLISVIVSLFCVNTQAKFLTQDFDDWARSKVKWSDENANIADRASDILQLGLTYAPVPMAIAEDKPTRQVLAMAVGQIAVAGSTQLAKVYFNRMRPNQSNRRSFWSGHSSAAWAGATAFCQMDKDACIPSYMAAAATSYLRVAADRHWASDVIVGAVVGHAGGKIIPALIWSY